MNKSWSNDYEIDCKSPSNLQVDSGLKNASKLFLKRF